MPEGPEVRRFTDSLKEFVLNKTLSNIEIISGRYYKSNPEGFLKFKDLLPIKISNIDCKGKFIYFELDNQISIWNTLGMSGSWTKEHNEFTRIVFKFFDQDPIYFNDIRNFGTVKFCFSKTNLIKKLQSLGPDVLTTQISDQELAKKLSKFYNKSLPEFLMNQNIISGIGNYLKAESLYLSKLSPHRLAGSLNNDEVKALNKAIHSVIRESYKSGGSTLKTYADFNGEKGKFSDRFMVYGQDKDPLGNLVIREETLDKRTTHWVPAIQK